MAATTFGPAAGEVEMRHSGASLPCSTDSWRSSPQNDSEFVAIELVDLAVGLEVLLQRAVR